MTMYHLPYKEPGTYNNTDKDKNKLVHEVLYIVFESMLLERLLLLISTWISTREHNASTYSYMGLNLYMQFI